MYQILIVLTLSLNQEYCLSTVFHLMLLAEVDLVFFLLQLMKSEKETPL